MNREKRAAIQSVRAKARKGLAVGNVKLPTSITKHFDAVIAWADKALATSKKAKDETDTDDAVAA